VKNEACVDLTVRSEGRIHLQRLSNHPVHIANRDFQRSVVRGRELSCPTVKDSRLKPPDL